MRKDLDLNLLDTFTHYALIFVFPIRPSGGLLDILKFFFPRRKCELSKEGDVIRRILPAWQPRRHYVFICRRHEHTRTSDIVRYQHVIDRMWHLLQTQTDTATATDRERHRERHRDRHRHHTHTHRQHSHSHSHSHTHTQTSNYPQIASDIKRAISRTRSLLDRQALGHTSSTRSSRHVCTLLKTRVHTPQDTFAHSRHVKCDTWSSRSHSRCRPLRLVASSIYIRYFLLNLSALKLFT